jgi:hypothetical protein
MYLSRLLPRVKLLCRCFEDISSKMRLVSFVGPLFADVK